MFRPAARPCAEPEVQRHSQELNLVDVADPHVGAQGLKGESREGDDQECAGGAITERPAEQPDGDEGGEERGAAVEGPGPLVA